MARYNTASPAHTSHNCPLNFTPCHPLLLRRLYQADHNESTTQTRSEPTISSQASPQHNKLILPPHLQSWLEMRFQFHSTVMKSSAKSQGRVRNVTKGTPASVQRQFVTRVTYMGWGGRAGWLQSFQFPAALSPNAQLLGMPLNSRKLRKGKVMR